MRFRRSEESTFDGLKVVWKSEGCEVYATPDGVKVCGIFEIKGRAEFDALGVLTARALAVHGMLKSDKWRNNLPTDDEIDRVVAPALLAQGVKTAVDQGMFEFVQFDRCRATMTIAIENGALVLGPDEPQAGIQCDNPGGHEAPHKHNKSGAEWTDDMKGAGLRK